MGLARLILKPQDYNEVGDVSREEIREIVSVSGPNPLFLIVLAALSTGLALLKVDLLAFVIYVVIYIIVRAYAPHWTITLSWLIPRAIIKAYIVVVYGATIPEVSIYYGGVLAVAIINEKIRITCCGFLVLLRGLLVLVG